MAEDREQTIELLTATQVAMADLYYSIMEENPMLAKLMMDKMKSFLTKDCYAAMERQTVLMRFLQEHTDLDVIHEVLGVWPEMPEGLRTLEERQKKSYQIMPELEDLKTFIASHAK